MEAFCGIDVAFAKRERFPVCLCVRENSALIPLQLAAHDLPDPPRGHGNAASIDPFAVVMFADEVVRHLRLLEKYFSVSIRRIAIDAPSDPRQECLPRRQAETTLDKLRISCFGNPSVAML